MFAKHGLRMQSKGLLAWRSNQKFYLLPRSIMYSQKYLLDVELVLWVKQQIELLATNYLNSTHFCKYLTIMVA
jgi:hypothetical protein